MAKSKLKILLTIGILLIISVGLLLYLNSNTQSTSHETINDDNHQSPQPTSSSLDKAQIALEIDRLRNAPYTTHQLDNIKVSDLSTLDMLTKQDETAHEIIEEATWLIEKNELEHVTHSLYALSEYLRTNTHDVCIPHELSHVYLFLQHNDIERVQQYVPEIQDHQEEWLTNAETKFKPFPPYYKSYQLIKDDIIQVIPRLANNQFDETTMALLKHISGNVIC